jgi:hypothetical protein
MKMEKFYVNCEDSLSHPASAKISEKETNDFMGEEQPCFDKRL